MKIGILWDLDGTLLDTLDDLTDAVNYALAFYGYPLRTREEVRGFVGNGVRKLICRALPEDASVEPVLATFQQYYFDHCQEKTAPYPGVLDALQILGERYPMAVVSNKLDGAVKDLCSRWFPGIYGLGERADLPRKPAPDMVKKAMQELGVDSCVYVGDSEPDVLTAKNAGVPCLSVLWGFRSEEELKKAGAVHFCAQPEELKEILDKMIGEHYGK